MKLVLPTSCLKLIFGELLRAQDIDRQWLSAFSRNEAVQSLYLDVRRQCLVNRDMDQKSSIWPVSCPIEVNDDLLLTVGSASSGRMRQPVQREKGYAIVAVGDRSSISASRTGARAGD